MAKTIKTISVDLEVWDIVSFQVDNMSGLINDFLNDYANSFLIDPIEGNEDKQELMEQVSKKTAELAKMREAIKEMEAKEKKKQQEVADKTKNRTNQHYHYIDPYYEAEHELKDYFEEARKRMRKKKQEQEEKDGTNS